ncbi:MAG: CBS domain-containing protein [Candidatus Heimdallarchaeota archaeon]|nr:CBS domain-containing protein [Candidatus Heimdallarchaeota archaeon]
MFPNLREIKRIREKIGWSQSLLSEKVNISQSAITKYENGSQIPSYEIATKIFEVLMNEELKFDPNVEEVMTRSVKTVTEDVSFGQSLEIMKKYSISQIPVVRKSTMIGTISENRALDLFDSYHNLALLKEQKVVDIMDKSLPTVPYGTKITEITPLLRRFGGVIIIHNGNLDGIITKADLLFL